MVTIREVFALSKEALSVEPLEEVVRVPQLVILDVREIRDRVIDCIARSDGGSISEGRELQDIGGDSVGAVLIKVEMIVRRGERLSYLPAGQTARVTLAGVHVVQVRPGTVLVAI